MDRQVQLNDLLQVSIGQYRGLLNSLLTLSSLLDQGMPQAICACLQEGDALHNEIRQIDAKLQGFLEATGMTGADQSLHRERLTLLREVGQKSEELAKAARIHLALVAEELGRIRNGRQLVGSYHSGGSKRGGLLQESC